MADMQDDAVPVPPPTRAPRGGTVRRLAGRIAALALLGAILVLPFTPLFIESRAVAIAAAAVYLTAAAISLLIVHLLKGDSFEKRDLLLRYVSLHYQRLLYPANYGETPKELVEPIIRRRLQPIQSLFSLRKIFSAIAVRLLVLFSIAFIFSLGAMYLYFSIYDQDRPYGQVVLIVLNSMLRGAALDLFEVYGIRLIDTPQDSFLFQTLDFLIRSVVSISVLGGLVGGVKLWEHRQQFKREFGKPGSSFHFFQRLNQRMHDWMRSIPPSVGSAVEVGRYFDSIVLPFLWEQDGPKAGVTFQQYAAGMDERFQRGPLGHLKDVDALLLENWRVPRQTRARPGPPG